MVADTAMDTTMARDLLSPDMDMAVVMGMVVMAIMVRDITCCMQEFRVQTKIF